MYKAFSDIANINRMVRKIIVFQEEETLQMLQFDWKGSPYPKVGNYMKYVSTPKGAGKREVYIFWDKRIEKNLLDFLAASLKNKAAFFNGMEKYFRDSYGQFRLMTDDFYDKGRSYFSKLSNVELLRLLKDFHRADRYVLSGYYIVYNLLEAMGALVKDEIAKVLKSDTEVEKVINSLTLGVRSLVREERVDFLHKTLRIQALFKHARNFDSPQIKNLIFKHWYAFGPCIYNHETSFVYSLSDFRNKFFRNLKTDAKKEMGDIKKQERDEKRGFEKICGKFLADARLRQHIGWIRKMLGYRNYETLNYYIYFDHALSFFDAIAGRVGLATEDLWFLSKNEMVESLRGRISPKIIVRKRRAKGFTIKQVGRRIKVLTGVSRRDYHIPIAKSEVVIKGNCAFRGKETGIARIIHDPIRESARFMEGEILVTSMTTPDFVPLMKKAGAVITDEGGLLCHAAIVARELKIPCVTGTKSATKIIKSGNLVKVDATNGAVEILKK